MPAAADLAGERLRARPPPPRPVHQRDRLRLGLARVALLGRARRTLRRPPRPDDERRRRRVIALIEARHRLPFWRLKRNAPGGGHGYGGMEKAGQPFPWWAFVFAGGGALLLFTGQD